jgi:transposase
VLLKVMLFGYSRGLTSSRDLEKACRENVTFMALACGQKPDHSTIAAFVSSMKVEILPLFRDVLLVCDEERVFLEGHFSLWMVVSFPLMLQGDGVGGYLI